jgi:hypothetical protein
MCAGAKITAMLAGVSFSGHLNVEFEYFALEIKR